MVSRTAQPLNEETLGALGGGVETPAYDRRRLKPSIVHVGVGGFHRAHQAVYLDDLAAGGSDWGEIGAGLLPHDRAMAEALRPQGALYTVVERSAQGDRARVIGSMIGYLLAPENPESLLTLLAAPSTRLVTLTITEGGYNINEATREFNVANEDVKADLQNPSSPRTVFGYLVEALDRRRSAGTPPFTVLCCDNIQGNGHVTQNAFVSFARLRDDGLANWMEEHVAFPNSMVDRITPQTTDADRAMVAEQFGIADRWPVVTEPFRQWVVEDIFSDGRPALEEAGVQMVGDVHPYETMKLRLLNASHSAIGYTGALAGYDTIDKVMGDPLFRTLMEWQMREDVAPLLPPVPGIDLDAYQQTLVERFSNPKIADQVARICLDGSAKLPKFVIPALRDALDAGRPHRWLTVALAGWLRYLNGVDDAGEPIELQEPRLAELQPLAREGRDDPRPLLGTRDLFGDLGDREAFVAELGNTLHDLYTQGTRATLAQYLERAAV